MNLFYISLSAILILGPQCEQDIMYNIEKAHFILDEMISNGKILDTNKKNVLLPLQLMDEIELGTL